MAKMVPYLSLDLDDAVIDWALARRLPPGLAAYYLAVPLGSEDGAVSVAMVHPENESGLAVLGALLAAPIVPVRASEAAIRQVLARMGAVAPATQARVLVWSEDPGMLEAVGATAALFAQAFAATVTTLAGPGLGLHAALAVAREGGYELTVLSAPVATTPAQLWAEAATSLLVLGAPDALRRILVVLRGYSADCQALEWLAPLLQQPGVVVTLLPLPPSAEAAKPSPVSLRRARDSHLQECLHHPALQEALVSVRFRQGRAIEQVVAEARHNAYDLVVIAAEGYGHFVSRVLTALEKGAGDRRQSFFILKPPAAAPPGGSETKQQRT